MTNTLTKEQVEEARKYFTDAVIDDPLCSSHYIETVDALCDLALQALDMMPRPISEAPKDGSTILLFSNKWTVGFWQAAVEQTCDSPPFEATWTNYMGDECNPTRWLPLSALPTGGEAT